MLKKYVVLLGLLITGYSLVTFNTPPDPVTLARFGISLTQLQLINLTLLLPLVVIWLLAVYGFVVFKEYALKIIDNPDGRAFNTLANGLMVLAYMMPVSSLASSILTYLSRSYPDFTTIAAVANRYIPLGLAILAFVLIHRGSKSLAALATKKSAHPRYLWCAILVLLAGSIYIYLTITFATTGQRVFHLPLWLIIPTVIVPYLFIWYLGLKSAILISFYKKNVQGILYKQALSRLAVGIGMVVGASIISQLFSAFSSQFIAWGLQSVLVLVYLLVIIIGVGYVLIALGAKRLKRIEEV